MVLNKILAQIFGIMATCVNGVQATSIKKDNILKYNCLANTFSAIQYILLGAYTGCSSCIIAAIRNIIFGHYNKKGMKAPKWVLIAYIIITITINIPLYNSWYSIIPVMNIVVFGYAIWQDNVVITKLGSMFAGATGLVYNFLVEAYVSLINALIDLIGGTIGFIRKLKEKED